MAPRILLAEDASVVTEAVRRGASLAGAKLEAWPVAEAAEHFTPGEHLLAIVRATERGRLAMEAMRERDPALPLLALFYDDLEAQAAPDLFGADGSLVGPLTQGAIAGAVKLAVRLRNATRDALALRDELGRAEAARSRALALARGAVRAEGSDRGLELMKRLMVLEVKRSRRHRLPVSLALLGVDGLVAPGREARPSERAKALAEALAIVTAALREIDLAVPFPDERIAVLLPLTSRAGALGVASRILNRVRHAETPLHMTLSAGVASHDEKDEGPVSFASLLRGAAEALSRARAAGGDQVVAAHPPGRRERIVLG